MRRQPAPAHACRRQTLPTSAIHRQEGRRGDMHVEQTACFRASVRKAVVSPCVAASWKSRAEAAPLRSFLAPQASPRGDDSISYLSLIPQRRLGEAHARRRQVLVLQAPTCPVLSAPTVGTSRHNASVPWRDSSTSPQCVRCSVNEAQSGELLAQLPIEARPILLCASCPAHAS